MTDIRTCLAEGAGRLAAAGIDNPRGEARLLLSHATGLSQAVVIGYPEREIGVTDDYTRLIDRRAAREPVSHLIGQREFWSLDFEVTQDTLDPRPDSETLVEAALSQIVDKNAEIAIADFGTGTGCLLAALLSMLPKAWGLGIDKSLAAAAVASRNLASLGLESRARIIVGEWNQALKGKFDLVVSNPPYIPTAKIETLQPEVARFEPRMALDGGRDGLDAIREIAQMLPNLLERRGSAVIEFGDGQSEMASQIVDAVGLHVRYIRPDLAGRPRCLVCGLTKS
jgi:release factor glutamine methyltransferase